MKGILAELAYKLMKEGFIIYGWTDKRIDENEYHSICLGKENSRDIVSVMFDFDGRIVLNKRYVPSSDFGSACFISELNPDELTVGEVKEALDAPVWVENKGKKPDMFKDILAWGKYEEKFNMYFRITDDDLVEIRIREWAMGLFDDEELGVENGHTERGKIDIYLEKVYHAKKEEWDRYGRRYAVKNYMMGLGSGMKVPFETYEQERIMNEFKVRYNAKEPYKAFYDMVCEAMGI